MDSPLERPGPVDDDASDEVCRNPVHQEVHHQNPGDSEEEDEVQWSGGNWPDLVILRSSGYCVAPVI